MELTIWAILCSLRTILPSPARRTLSMIAGTSCWLLADRYDLASAPSHGPAMAIAIAPGERRRRPVPLLHAMVGEMTGNAERTGLCDGGPAPDMPTRIT